MSISGYADTLAVPAPAPRRQNWILGPGRDAMFIIGAAPLVLALAIALFGVRGAASATALILLTHIVMTVAHHLPTFIRIYGDVELFRQHRWTFLLAPLLPFTVVMAVLTYLNLHDLPVENVLYMFILLALWDPWHFLMQHYGFTRIYDRDNAAPPRLAARMDLLLSASLFIAIMAASVDWLPQILEDLYVNAHIPLIFALPGGAASVIGIVAGSIAAAAVVAYAIYLVWCRRRGYSVSYAKLALYLSFFGVMALAYTPNPLILSLAPGWTFKAGFAVVGVVHMTQYLAIVWRYNRSLASRGERARGGLFSRLHGRGGWIIGAAYVTLCLAYGGVITGEYGNRWLMSFLIALGFTSTLMHYYYDGFIWKLRQAPNREALALPTRRGEAGGAASAGTPAPRGAAKTLLRHTLYFGVPMAVLSVGAFAAWQEPASSYVGYMVRAHVLNEQGRANEALEQAQAAVRAMDRQLPLARRLAELQPTAAREAALAFLIHDRSRYERLLIPSLNGAAIGADAMQGYRHEVDEAADVLQRALTRGGSPAHPGRENISTDDARRVLAAWRAEARQTGP